MKKHIKDVIRNIKIIKFFGKKNIHIKNICIDSRIAKKHDVFIAIKGKFFNGFDFINQAIKNGSKCIICDQEPIKKHKNITYIIVDNTKQILPILARDFYNNPSCFIKIIGVTGTNGKTTTATLLYNVFSMLGEKTTLISTINIIILKKTISTQLTTPNVVEINKILYKSIKKKCKYVFMEVSSHAITQQRISKINFFGMVFTNISHDHIDYHKNFNNYILTKKKIFDDLPKNSFALTNIDDEYGFFLVKHCKAHIKTYAMNKNSDFNIKIIKRQILETLISINGKKIKTKLIGDFNMYNLLAVYSVCSMLDKKIDHNIFYKLKNINGRFEIIKNNNSVYDIIIDYAHNPQALQNIINNIQYLYNKKITYIIIGCGGNRDKQKRPIMAKIASNNCDTIILTSDNSRNENPQAIINDMKKGLHNNYNVLEIIDRKLAIKTAIKNVKIGDIILVVGKGHENFQEIKNEKKKFNDKKVILKILKNINKQ